MRKISFLILVVSFSSLSFCQGNQAGSVLLPVTEVDSLLSSSMKKQIGINFSVFRVYKNWDKLGVHYIALLESRDSIGLEKDTFNRQIKAITFSIENNNIKKLWEIRDQIVESGEQETSIWFWTRYIQFIDLNNDFIIDPMIVYGTNTVLGQDYNRVNIIVIHKSKKVVIRHQNHSLDFGRLTLVDRAFYFLPKALQKTVIKKMQEIERMGHTIFPGGWEAQMKQRKTTLRQKNL